MAIERLLELIGKEEVVLWAGAGVSIYAGYPSANQLVGEIRQKLDFGDYYDRTHDNNLSVLTDIYCNLNPVENKIKLINFLRDVYYNRVPEDELFHTKIASIPHFKTIITTNYDCLFERAYGKNCHVVFNDNHLSKASKKSTLIFKVHGDLTEPEDVIITKSDYTRFFTKGDANKLMWNIVKERIATKTVLFMGYGFEDMNVEMIFDQVMEALQDQDKESFLVAPNLLQYQINRLKTKNITYIDAKADEIIDQAITYLNSTIAQDLQAGNVLAETVQLYLNKKGLNGIIKSEGDFFALSTLEKKEGGTNGEFHFAFSKDKKELYQKLLDITDGRSFEELTLPVSELEHSALWIEGIKISGDKDEGTYKFAPNPAFESLCRFTFKSGLEIDNVPFKLFGHPSTYMEFQIKYLSGKFKIGHSMDISIGGKFNYEHCGKCTNVTDEIMLSMLLVEISKGAGWKMSFDNGTGNVQTLSLPVTLGEPFALRAQFYLNYFKNLKVIEDFYGVRFKNFELDGINQRSVNISKVIVASILKEKRYLKCNNRMILHIADFSKAQMQQVETIHSINPEISVINKKNETIELHGITINLGWRKTTYYKAYVTNYKTMMNQKSKKMSIKSKINKISIEFIKH